VHIEFRRSAHSLALADIPFVLGLVFASGDQFVLGAAVGTALVLAVHRRSPLVRTIFNGAQVGLAAAVGVGFVHAFYAGDPLTAPSTWLVLYVTILECGCLTVLCIAAAVAISEGGMTLRDVGGMLLRDGIIGLASASVGIAAAMVLSLDARGTIILAVPALAVFGAYRAFYTERRRHRRLDLLYKVTRHLASAPDLGDALGGLLDTARDALHSDVAEAIVIDADGIARRVTLGPEGEVSRLELADPEFAAELMILAERDGPVVALSSPVPGRIGEEMARRDAPQALIGLLRGETRTIGTLMVANRLGVDGYTAEDAELLESLANTASVTLQYERLERVVSELEVTRDQLHHQATHDSLTGLPNRAEFLARAQDLLQSGTGSLAVVFVDVDDFKQINDSFGHAVGDAVLVEVGQRLMRAVRPGDLVARLSGDEFAVAVADEDDRADLLAKTIADRVLHECLLPVTAGDHLVSTQVSLGIAAHPRGDGDADSLVRAADMAMYGAKTSGKGRYSVAGVG
jgi:diguanylate cyclase (GGDEF)-like protein